jgi:hypothetical protein
MVVGTLDVATTHPSLLRTEYVWDGFTLLALLEDYSSQGNFLLVPHSGRFDDVMIA